MAEASQTIMSVIMYPSRPSFLLKITESKQVFNWYETRLPCPWGYFNREITKFPLKLDSLCDFYFLYKYEAFHCKHIIRYSSTLYQINLETVTHIMIIVSCLWPYLVKVSYLKAVVDHVKWNRQHDDLSSKQTHLMSRGALLLNW